MSFLRAIKEFLESIFLASSPEVKKRMEMRKIENELKLLPSQILKNGFLQPNFAELIRVLYENTKPINDILSQSVASDDLKRNGRFEAELIITGFDEESQVRMQNLSYESRKQSIMDSDMQMNKQIELQKRGLENLLKQLSAPGFLKIDDTLCALKQLADICKFNYLNIIYAFDQDFEGLPTSRLGIVAPVAPSAVADFLQDLYYITGGLKIDVSEVRAICALKQLLKGGDLSESEKEHISENLKKINSVFSKYLTQDVFKRLICFGKKDTSINFQFATYRSNSLKNFIEYMQKKFASDTERIKGEIKDYTVSFEIKELFGDKELENIKFYNSDTNEFLRSETPYSFVWITPIQVLKTFLTTFLTADVKQVLNNIVIEGFFNNSNYKAEFSSTIYSVNEIDNMLSDFEKTFGRGEQNDEAELRGLVRDSHTNAEFLKKVGSMVDNINNQAHKLVQDMSKILYELYVQVGELIIDAKKSKSDMISNIKVLLSSARNHSGAGMLEQRYENWKLFLKIMKNYAIIGEIEKSTD